MFATILWALLSTFFDEFTFLFYFNPCPPCSWCPPTIRLRVFQRRCNRKMWPNRLSSITEQWKKKKPGTERCVPAILLQPRSQVDPAGLVQVQLVLRNQVGAVHTWGVSIIMPWFMIHGDGDGHDGGCLWQSGRCHTFLDGLKASSHLGKLKLHQIMHIYTNMNWSVIK